MEARISWDHNVSPADWLIELLHPFATDVGSIVPEGYPAYARVLHPVIGAHGDRRRWRAIADANGRIVHPEVQLHMINRRPGTAPPAAYEPGNGYDSGSLPRPQRDVLIELLRSRTTTPEQCWYCVWEGFAGLDDQGVETRVEAPARRYLFGGGPIDIASRTFLPLPSDQSANIWWPEDRAWVVATEVDHAWTYVAGAREVVDRVLADPRLEAVESLIHHQFTYDSDYLNAALDGT